jgi:hypothetical protein
MANANVFHAATSADVPGSTGETHCMDILIQSAQQGSIFSLSKD